MGKKALGEPRLSLGPVLLWPTNELCMIMIQATLQVKRQIGSEHSQYPVPSSWRSELSRRYGDEFVEVSIRPSQG